MSQHLVTERVWILRVRIPISRTTQIPNPRLPVPSRTSMPLLLPKPVPSVFNLLQRFPPSRSRDKPVTPIPPLLVAPCLDPEPPLCTLLPAKVIAGAVAHGGAVGNRGFLSPDHSRSSLQFFQLLTRRALKCHADAHVVVAFTGFLLR